MKTKGRDIYNCNATVDSVGYIITSIFTDALKRAENIAHEGYGHAFFMNSNEKNDSIGPFHRYIETLEPGETTFGCTFTNAVYTRTLIKTNPIE